MTLERFAVLWTGGLIVVFGVLYVVATEPLLALAELTSLSPTALTDARVMYGAFQIGPGLFMLASLKRREWLEPALALATILFVCIPAVRLVGIVRDDAASTYHLAALVIEIATCALAWTAWRGVRRAQ
jgi:hypothetical protein